VTLSFATMNSPSAETISQPPFSAIVFIAGTRIAFTVPNGRINAEANTEPTRAWLHYGCNKSAF